VFTALGTYLLWFGWYGFNPGSAITISGPTDPILVSRTAVNSTLASGAGGVAAAVVFFLRSGYSKKWDTMMLCNGALCGLVSLPARLHGRVLAPSAAERPAASTATLAV
jgi:Amt family ammonium transporter